MKNVGNEPAWDEPIVGYSNGADPLYDFYKRDIGGFFRTPIEFMKHTYPNLGLKPQQLTVISWILPQTKATKTDNRKETKWPSERWARTRIFGEEMNNELRRHVVNALISKGVEAVAPMLSPLWDRAISEPWRRCFPRSGTGRSLRSMASPQPGPRDMPLTLRVLAPSGYATD